MGLPLHDVVDIGVTKDIWDPVLQGLGRHVEFKELFELRVGLKRPKDIGQ